MTTVFTVRDVPDDIARTIKLRAAEAGQSLQGYLLNLILREASKPTPAEMAARAERYASDQVDHEDVLAAPEEERRGC